MVTAHKLKQFKAECMTAHSILSHGQYQWRDVISEDYARRWTCFVITPHTLCCQLLSVNRIPRIVCSHHKLGDLLVFLMPLYSVPCHFVKPYNYFCILFEWTMEWKDDDHNLKSKQVIRPIEEFTDLPISTDTLICSAIRAGTSSTDTKSALVRINGWQAIWIRR